MGNEDGAEVDVFLIYKDDDVKGSPEGLVVDVEAAVKAANDALTRDGDELVWAEATLPSVKGVMFQLRYVGNRQQNQEWLQVLSSTLESAGRSGTVTLAPRASETLFEKLWSVPKVTGFAAYSLSDPPPTQGASRWRVDPATTAAICAHAVQWGFFPGADIYLSQSTATVLVEDPDVAGPLAGAVRRFPQASVAYGSRRPPGYNRISFGFNGQVCYQAHTAELEWMDRVRHVRQALLRGAGRLDLAFIRLQAGTAGMWTALSAAQPPLPYIREPGVRYNRHLWDRYTPDAHAIQVLTGRHLERANDLSEWNITPLDGDRYLVEARDLAAWFSRDVPDEAALEQARVEFGAMILTPAVTEMGG